MPTIHGNLAVLYSYNKDFLNAEKEYLKEIEINPANSIPYTNLAKLYDKLNNPKKAKLYRKKARNFPQ